MRVGTRRLWARFEFEGDQLTNGLPQRMLIAVVVGTSRR